MKKYFYSLKIWVFSGMSILCILSTMRSANAATFVNDGVAVSEIVLPSPSEPREQDAANELQEYFQKISGVTVAIVTEGAQTMYPIYIGNTTAANTVGLLAQASALVDDGYILKITPTETYLVGKDPLATAFSVYGILDDHLGVRWFMPDDLGEYVPTATSISIIEQTEIKEPSFAMRKVVPQGAWGRHNKMNSGSVDSTYGMRMNGGYHSWFRFIPATDYFTDHPDFFAMVDGERTVHLNADDSHKNQLETGNPNLRDEFVNRVIEMFDNNPTVDITSISANDGTAFSESPESVALDDPSYPCTVEQVNTNTCYGEKKQGVLSKRMLTFYKEVSDRVLAVHPDKYLLGGAYAFYRTPPKNLNITMPNGAVVYITRQTCQNLALTSGGCNEIYTNTIDGWLEYFNKFMVYEYYWKNAAIGLPYPIIHSMRDDIPYYHQKNALGLSTQASINNVGTLHLEYYIAAKLLWDVNANVDELLEDYYAKFYGSASVPMKQYYEALEQAVIDHPEIELPAQYYEIPVLFSQGLLDDLNNYIVQAKDLVSGDAVRLERIEIQEASLGYTKRVVEYLTNLQIYLESYSSPWEIQEDTNNLPAIHQDKSDEIEQYLQDNVSKRIVRRTNDVYLDALLNPNAALKKVADCDGDKIVLNKEEWMTSGGDEQHLNAGQIVDIWVYGYDYDANSTQAEHEVSLVDNAGQNIVLGDLPEINDNHNKQNYTRIFKNINTEQLIVNSKLQLRILNKTGSWTQSNFNAIYVVPHDDLITDAAATQKIENEVERNVIRNQAFGFVEYCALGIPNKDGITLKADIESRFNIHSDVDQTGIINGADARLTLRNSLGLNMIGTNWQASSTTGDANCDGNSNSTDALLILRKALGLDMFETDWCEN